MRSIVLLSMSAVLAVSAFAQDWYQQRQQRFTGDAWRPHIFLNVKTDLEHIWPDRAHDKELERIAKTENELSTMQTDLDQTRWDNGILNDVIDSIRKSADDQRLSRRDRDILADDVTRLKEFQDMHHNH